MAHYLQNTAVNGKNNCVYTHNHTNKTVEKDIIKNEDNNKNDYIMYVLLSVDNQKYR